MKKHGEQTAFFPNDAADWVARMHLRELTCIEKDSLRVWLRSSPGRCRDLMRSESVWRMMGALANDDAIQSEVGMLRQRTAQSLEPIQLRPPKDSSIS